MSDVALSMRRMSLTSVQLLSERVAPQPLTPHQGERQREKERLRERNGRQREREQDRARERDREKTKEGGGRMFRDYRRKQECGRGRGLMGGGRERFFKDSEPGEGEVL